MQKAYDEAEKKVKKLNNTILRVGASMLMYKVFSAVVQSVGEYMGKVLKTNTEYMDQLSRLKGALLTAFQPLYQVAVPAMTALLRIATVVVSVLANVMSILSGSSLSENAENAAALNEEAEAIENVGDAAEKARKQILGFDEINKLESADSATGSSNGADAIQPDFSAFDTAQYKAKIDELTVYLSGALLALGAILAFSGANVPLGIGLMAVGAVGLATVAKENWSAMSPGLKKAFGDVTGIVSGALLAVGAVLAFSGAATPLGIGLMIAGVAGMAASTAINWGKSEAGRKSPRLVDWEKDFPYIVSPVNHVIGYEIRAAEYLHWWTFLAAYMEIKECVFSQIVRIRNLQAKGKPLDKQDREWYRNNAHLVNMPVRLSQSEREFLAMRGGKK